MSSGIICQVSPKIALDNSRFDDIVLAERFKIHWRKHLVFVLHSFDSNMKRFWDHVSLSAVFVVVVIFSRITLSSKGQGGADGASMDTLPFSAKIGLAGGVFL